MTARRKVTVPKGIPWDRRLWKEALMRELSRADDPRAGKAIDRIARLVVHNALNGDLDCIHEIANRLDGKPAVQMDPVMEDKLDKLTIIWGGGPGSSAKVVNQTPQKLIEGTAKVVE